MTLAEYKAREALTLTALAARLDRPVSTVHGWLKGHRRPDWASLEELNRRTGGAVGPADFLAADIAPRGAKPGPSRPGLGETQAPFASEARALGLDPEAIAAKALHDAVRAEKARRWQEENREAMDAWNAWTDANELPLAKYRLF